MSFISKLKSIFINDVQITNKSFTGNNVTIIGSKIIIDGIDCTPDLKNINIVINGDIQNLKIGACNNFQVTGNVGHIDASSANVTVTGNSGPIESSNGNVTVHQNVEGKVKTSNGDVTANTITGDVTTSNGDINAKSINGSVSM